MMCACIAKERGIERGSVHNSSPTQVLERSRRLSKDEMILRLGDGKAIAAEAVGSLRLVVSNHIRIDLKDCYLCQSNLIMTAQHKRKVDNHENAQIWHARLGHISKDRISSTIANGLLDLVHIDVCGPLSIPARGGFSYFITFPDDHSRYGYVYLMRYKSEAFGRFKEYRLEVENQTNQNEILSQWTPPGTPQLNGVAERRNRTLLDMVRSMMSFTELLPSFWGYALEMTAKLLNIAPSKFIGYPKETAGYYFYDPAEQKIFISRNAVFLEKGFLSDNRRDKLGADGEVTAFKARLVAKGYTQRPGADFEETYSPVAMAKFIRILLAIAACRRVLLLLEKNRKSVISKGPSTGSSKLPEAGTRVLMKSYEVMISSRTTMILVYTRRLGNSVAYLVLYVDDILLIGNDVKMLGDIKAWLSTQFSMKDIVSKTDEELKRMSNIPYASAVGSIQYVVQCTRSDVAYALSVTSRYQACAGEAHWGAVKSILKYLKRTKNMFLIYGGGELILEGYSDASFQSNDDDAKSQSGFVFKLNGVWLLGRVPSRIPQRIPLRKLNTSQLRKLPRRRFG
ncbi:UNVERIFIED_CONTAM: hypothetical protein Slati_3705100 [Sesamum latifolium]|uniref:Integrase catalytic domain-containing protein n=1 Tax=Sesamum latifolium TaxID=2727402 RepID=A0AAW2U2U7_9LAMI